MLAGGEVVFRAAAAARRVADLARRFRCAARHYARHEDGAAVLVKPEAVAFFVLGQRHLHGLVGLGATGSTVGAGIRGRCARLGDGTDDLRGTHGKAGRRRIKLCTTLLFRASTPSCALSVYRLPGWPCSNRRCAMPRQRHLAFYPGQHPTNQTLGEMRRCDDSLVRIPKKKKGTMLLRVGLTLRTYMVKGLVSSSSISRFSERTISTLIDAMVDGCVHPAASVAHVWVRTRRSRTKRRVDLTFA